jgi:hypothetical protein
MLVQEVFDSLRFGELSQLSIATSETGGISPEKYPTLLSHLQLGLTALYTRFTLREGRMRLELQPGVTVYQLTPAYAKSNRQSRQLVKYLDDLSEPFTGELLKLERVLTDADLDLPLNVERDPWSVFTPKASALRVPKALNDQAPDLPTMLRTTGLTLVYRANHPKINVEDFDLESTSIDLPDAYLEPLLYFIAARVHNPVGANNEGQVGMSWTSRYEAACRALENEGLDLDRGGHNDRLQRNGWV